jgi:glycogen operon protein
VRQIQVGSPFPLGATLTDEGANFALYSRSATQVFLQLFDAPDAAASESIELTQRDRFIWHAQVPGLRAGQLYGYRVHGDYQPAQGLRFNSAKLLLDPYAKAVSGKFRNVDDLLLAYDAHNGQADLVCDSRDDAAIVPKSVLIDDTFDWQGVSAPQIPLEKLIIYEVHVKGFTAHPSSGVAFPGTYLGFIDKIPYLQRLGVNAVELLPVQEYYVEDFLRQRGLTNYWGYNPIGFFAPESSYATGRTPGCQVTEFKTLVRELHRAGIQVILDVVFNHTGEGNQLGPTISLRGLDNGAYYALTGPSAAPRRYYDDWTGCGNAVRADDPAVIRLLMDSLRYWTQTMRVDGFRFDLASVLGREADGTFRSSAGFFTAVAQDPVLARTLLIAEPWDIGTYQSGNFPVDWCEWNGRFRDTLRRFGKGDGGQIADLGYRLTGSSDLFSHDGREACNSINFITCHDGFTLHDLVAYNGKHNERNGENNRDGSDDNNSWNCGLEGETNDAGVNALRRRLIRNHACHLLLSLGTPMIQGGDEFARTQLGNNNAYCQDNEISWHDWRRVENEAPLVEFFSKAIAFRNRFGVFETRRFLLGKDLADDGIPDLEWFSPEGGDVRWDDTTQRILCYQLDTHQHGDGAATRLFVMLNGDSASRQVRLPPLNGKGAWYRAIDTSLPPGQDLTAAGAEVRIDPADHYIINARSTVVLLAR